MRIINIVDNATKVNFGIWNAAISTVGILKRDYGIESELWFPNLEEHMIPGDITKVGLKDLSTAAVKDMINARSLEAEDTLIVSHGCWRFPTRWGYEFKRLGFPWMYVPHGMLEPWSLSQKKWQKKVYFTFKEKPMVDKADCIRAVGAPELYNLKHLFNRHQSLSLIPNGVPKHIADFKKKDKSIRYVLFMSRLHPKKGVTELVKAWLRSPLHGDENFKLIIAGPDQGELPLIEEALQSHENANVAYIGSVYGEEKLSWLNRSSFYILPSKSEGFPTAILEAMSFGLVPIITKGCNFPDVFEHQLGIRIKPTIEGVLHGLRTVKFMNAEKIEKLQVKASAYINAHYSLDEIARLQVSHFKSLLEAKSVQENAA